MSDASIASFACAALCCLDAILESVAGKLLPQLLAFYISFFLAPSRKRTSPQDPRAEQGNQRHYRLTHTERARRRTCQSPWPRACGS